MARLFSSGFELNSTAAHVEWTSVTGASIVTDPVRSGTYAGRVNLTSSGSQNFSYTFASANQTAPFFFRGYVRFVSFPSSETTLFSTRDSTSVRRVGLLCTASGELKLYNFEDSLQIGSTSSTLSLGTWYRIEIKVDTTTLSSTSAEAKIDDTSFASGTANLNDGINNYTVGYGLSANVTGEVLFDDVAINDSTGSFQNSWPGEGEITHLRPNEAGDNAGWVDGTGSTFAEVDEVTPDDITTYLRSDSSGQLTDLNIDNTPAALASDDIINCVHVGVRAASESADGTNTFTLRIKASSGGTVEESASLLHDTTTFSTNVDTVPRNYQLTLYDLPGAPTTAWTKADLDTAQIGLNHDTGTGTNDTNVSTLWLLVDHKPAEVQATPVPALAVPQTSIHKVHRVVSY